MDFPEVSSSIQVLDELYCFTIGASKFVKYNLFGLDDLTLVSESIANANRMRYKATLANVDDKFIFMIGGNVTFGGPLRICDKYDIEADAW